MISKGNTTETPLTIRTRKLISTTTKQPAASEAACKKHKGASGGSHGPQRNQVSARTEPLYHRFLPRCLMVASTT